MIPATSGGSRALSPITAVKRPIAFVSSAAGRQAADQFQIKDGDATMSKDVLIETIRRHNPTAASNFLMRFSPAALERYLTHLQHLAQPRSAAPAAKRCSGWREAAVV
jgi:hypothetical protein